jgi:ABC-type uncharacterized transport system substrate-binding protein
MYAGEPISIEKELESILQKIGGELISVKAMAEDQIDGAISELVQSVPELVYLPSASFVTKHAGKIIPPLNAKKIPTYGALKNLVVAGTMVGIVSSYTSVGRELAEKADVIFSRC